MFDMLLQPEPLLAVLDWYHWLFIIPLCVLSLFLTLLILVQRGRGGGLTGALGGMGGQSAFGTKAGDVFTKITIVVAMLWILLSMGALKVLHVGKFDTSNVTRPPVTTPKGTDPTGAEPKGTTPPLDTPPAGLTPENTPPPKTNTTPAPTEPAATPATPDATPPKNDDEKK